MPDPTELRTREEQLLAAAGEWDPLDEHESLAAVESKMFNKVAARQFRLSRYVLVHKLGSGAAGIVYRGYDPELDRAVAIKVLRPSIHVGLQTGNNRERFLREAKVVAKFAHVNVIAVHDVGTFDLSELAKHFPSDDDRPAERGTGIFIVMELVEGENLDRWLAAVSRSWSEVLEVFLQAGEGLAAAHAAGIVHRDFKPGNVLVRLAEREGRAVTGVKVADFGLALSVHDRPASGMTAVSDGSLPTGAFDADITEGGQRLTKTGVVLGTPAYMAPEQHRGEETDESADQYAFCVALYRALFGDLPYTGDDWSSLYNAKFEGKVSFPAAANVPAWLSRVLARGLKPNSQERYPSMRDLLDALRADPAKRLRRIVRGASVPLGLAGLVWGASVALQPGVVELEVRADGDPISGYSVTVDAEPRILGPNAEIELGAGQHVVEVSAPDYEKVVELVDVERGGTHQVAIDLVHEKGILDLAVEPRGGIVLIDGVDYGSRLSNFPIDTGNHEVVVRHEGYYDVRLALDVSTDQRISDFVALRRAVAWSKARSGSTHELAWIGDYDGDGFGDVLHRLFNTVSIYDPWTDETLWSQQLAGTPRVLTTDLDGDGAIEMLVSDWYDDRVMLVAYDSPEASGAPRKLWQHELKSRGALTFFSGDITLADVDGDGTDDVIAAAPGPGRVVALRGRDGDRLAEFEHEDETVALRVASLSDGVAVHVLGATALESFSLPSGRSRWRHVTRVTPHLGNTVDLPKREVSYIGAPGERENILRGLGRGRGAPSDLLVRSLETRGTRLDVFSNGGELRWTMGVEGRDPPQRMSDVDDDEVEELLLLDGSAGTVAVSGGTGRTLWSFQGPGRVTAQPWKDGSQLFVTHGPDIRRLNPHDGVLGDVTTLSVPITMPPRLWDWDGDGKPGVVVATEDASLVFLDPQLRYRESVLLPLRAQKVAAPADADRDGFSDLLIEARGPIVIRGPKVRWWRSTTDAIRGTPVAGDFDGNGTMEIALAGSIEQQGGFYILDAATGAFVVGPREDPGHDAIRGPEAISSAGRGPDFLVQGAARLTRFDGRDGHVMATTEHPHSYSRPAVADADGDGRDEVYSVVWEDPAHVIVSDAQTLEEIRRLPLGGGGWGQVVVADVDGDGRREVAATRHDGHVVVFDSMRWGERWAAKAGERLAFGVTPVRRRDGDGVDFAVTPTSENNPVVLLSGVTGQVLWSIDDIGSGRGRPVSQDVDGDGSADIFVAGGLGTVSRLAYSGEVMWTVDVVSTRGKRPGTSGQMSLADLDGDGALELLTGWEDGTVRVFSARDGQLVWVFHTGGEIEAAPVAVDVDGDGVLEVIVASHDRRIYCLNHRAASRGD